MLATAAHMVPHEGASPALAQYASEASGATVQLLDMLASAAPVVAPHPAAAVLLRCARGTLRRHRCTLAVLCGTGRGPCNPSFRLALPSASASNVLRAVYAALNDLAAVHTMLHAAALAVGEPETASVARRLLGELTPLVFHFSRVLPCVVAREVAAADPSADAAAGERSRECTQSAWSRGALHAALGARCESRLPDAGG